MGLAEFARNHPESDLNSKIEQVASALSEIKEIAAARSDMRNEFNDYLSSYRLFCIQQNCNPPFWFDALPTAAFSFGVLSDPEVSKVFVECPEKFVELQKFGRSGFPSSAFVYLANIAYAEGPWEDGTANPYRRNLLSLLKNADMDFVGVIGKALCSGMFDETLIPALNRLYSSQLFHAHRVEANEILRYSSFETASSLISDRRINQFFSREPRFFVDIAEILGEDAHAAYRFMFLPLDLALRKMGRSIPQEEYAAIVGANPHYQYIQENKERFLEAFRFIAHSIGNPKKRPCEKTGIAGAFYSLDYAASRRLPSDWAQAFFDAQHLIQAGSFEGKDAAFVCLAVGMDCVSSLRTDEEKISKIKDILRVLEERGIEFYYRYTSKTIENVYLTATEPGFSDGERNGFPIKTALVISTKIDPNGAFSRMDAEIDPLIDHGYNIILCEAEYADEVEKRLLNNGLLHQTGTPAKYDLLVIAGHGFEFAADAIGTDRLHPLLEKEPNNIFGAPYGNAFGDYLFGDWASMFNENAKVILDSCSTGREEYVPGFLKTRTYLGNDLNPGNYQNIAQAISDKVKIGVFAPTEPTFLREIFFDESGRVSNVAYGYEEPPFGVVGSTTNYIDESKKR